MANFGFWLLRPKSVPSVGWTPLKGCRPLTARFWSVTVKTIGIPPSKFMGGNAKSRSNHLTWEKVSGNLSQKLQILQISNQICNFWFDIFNRVYLQGYFDLWVHISHRSQVWLILPFLHSYTAKNIRGGVALCDDHPSERWIHDI